MEHVALVGGPEREVAGFSAKSLLQIMYIDQVSRSVAKVCLANGPVLAREERKGTGILHRENKREKARENSFARIFESEVFSGVFYATESFYFTQNHFLTSLRPDSNFLKVLKLVFVKK